MDQNDLNHIGLKLLEYELNLARMLRENERLKAQIAEYEKAKVADAPAPAQEAQNG